MARKDRRFIPHTTTGRYSRPRDYKDGLCKRGHNLAEVGVTPSRECRQCANDRRRKYSREKARAYRESPAGRAAQERQNAKRAAARAAKGNPIPFDPDGILPISMRQRGRALEKLIWYRPGAENEFLRGPLPVSGIELLLALVAPQSEVLRNLTPSDMKDPSQGYAQQGGLYDAKGVRICRCHKEPMITGGYRPNGTIKYRCRVKHREAQRRLDAKLEKAVKR